MRLAYNRIATMGMKEKIYNNNPILKYPSLQPFSVATFS
jgi:hypothetical protein